MDAALLHPVWTHSGILGEFLGTFILILLGNGVNASVNLNKTYAKIPDGW